MTRPSGPLGPSHEIIDHTSELRLRLRAGSFGELLAEAGRALAAVQLRRPVPPAGGDWRHLEVSAPDRPGLLADWLNELIYLAETERWVGSEFEVERAEPGTLAARARGVTVERVPGLVKAATLHGLRVDDVPGGVSGEVVLDI
ncbi:MAG TPA: archease [Gemmatimonadales bacterium]|nr:archease [Gemmatimonadales bacterium]